MAVVGRSGSGKSTLLNLLGCLDRSDGGELWFGDERLTGAGRRALARFRGRHLGFVFQAYNLIPELTAWENVLLAARYVGRAAGGGRGGGARPARAARGLASARDAVSARRSPVASSSGSPSAGRS